MRATLTAAVRSVALSAALSVALFASAATAATTYGPELEGFAYPFPVRHHAFRSQGIDLRMAYMDVAPTGTANGGTVVLMHGKNFCSATWEATIRVLADAGYRVIAPDQVGWCASTKPPRYQYTFDQLATNTMALLKSLGIDRVSVVGHSTGGMLAARFALMYPDATRRLVLVDPIGLEDWRELGVPYRTVDDWYARELKLDADGIRDYERKTYYVGTWKPEYERWVDMLAGLNAGPGHALVAWNSALIYDMIFTQPFVHEVGDLKMPVLLMVGTADTTAIGSDIAPPALKARLGHYDVLGRQVVARIPRGTLVEFEGLGHAPQLQDPDRFHAALLKGLSGE